MPQRHSSALAAAALLLSGCPSPECPSGTVAIDGRCVDVTDTGPRADAFTPDVSGDAPGLDVNLPDVWEPDAWTPDDAWAPDAGFDGGPCSRWRALVGGPEARILMVLYREHDSSFFGADGLVRAGRVVVRPVTVLRRDSGKVREPGIS